MLTDTSRIFDVLGSLSPITVYGKILLQKLWHEQLNWDDPLSVDLKSKFLGVRPNFKSLTNYCVPRCYSLLNNVNCRQLVGFCEVSPKAHCAIIFIRVIDCQNNITT